MRALCAVLLLVASAGAQEPVRIETQLRPERGAWVGQRISLEVTLTMSERPSASPRFELPELQGALFVQAPGSPTLGSQRVEGVEYTSQRYELMLFTRRPGELHIPPVRVRVTLDGREHTLATEPLTLSTSLPEGVEAGTPLITTTEFEVEELWQPLPGKARVGDAFQRSVTLRARDQLGIALPPLPAPRLEGLDVYRDDPLVEDRLERGTLTCKRSDSYTLVCTRAGTYELPALVYVSWNPRSKRLERVELSARTLIVAPAPTVAQDVQVPGSPRRGPRLLLAALVVLTLAGLLFRRHLVALLRARRARRAECESAYFRRLVRACGSGDAREAWPALTAWTARVSGARETLSVREFALHEGSRDLLREAERLQRALLDSSPWSGGELLAALTAVRRALAGRARTAAAQLNPLEDAGPLVSRPTRSG